MDYFHYKEDALYAEDVALKDVAEKYGTPAFIYSKATLERHARAYINSFKSMEWTCVFFS
jgi:diaminopimelate decarboxylase